MAPNRWITGLENLAQTLLKTTENFLDVRPLKVDFIQTEKRDSSEKLESITFKLNVNLMDLTFVLKSEPRKKVFTVFSTDVIREKASLNSSSGNILYQNINDECKIEDQSSLFRKYRIHYIKSNEK